MYVDDFKLAAKRTCMAKFWKQLRMRINLDDPTPPERFLGCYTHRFECPVEEMLPMLATKPEFVERVQVQIPVRTGTVTRGKNKHKSKKIVIAQAKTPSAADKYKYQKVVDAQASTAEFPMSESEPEAEPKAIFHEYKFRDRSATARGYMYDMTE